MRFMELALEGASLDMLGAVRLSSRKLSFEELSLEEFTEHMYIGPYT